MFRPYVLDHVEAGRDVLELFGYILTDLRELFLAAATGAELLVDVKDDALPPELLGDRVAAVAFLLAFAGRLFLLDLLFDLDLLTSGGGFLLFPSFISRALRRQLSRHDGDTPCNLANCSPFRPLFSNSVTIRRISSSLRRRRRF